MVKNSLPNLKKPKYQKLQIGCGWNKMNGFVNIDKTSDVKPDLVVNIEEGLPFQDNSFVRSERAHV